MTVHRRARSAIAALCLLLVLLLVGCEAIGAPEAYRSQVCGAARDLSGPLADSMAQLQAASARSDRAAMLAAADVMQAVIDRVAARLVDVPLWVPGLDVVTDMRTLTAGYAAAIASLRQAIASGEQGRIDAAMAALAAAAQAAPGLGDHMRTARLAGLNC